MDNINNFNSLTGEKLTKGQSYTNAQGNTVTQGTALTPQQLQPVSPIQTVPVGDTTSGLAGITASVGDQIAGDLGNIQNQIAQQEKLNQNQGNDLASLLLQQGNQAQDLVNEQAKQGVNEETANFNKLQEQLLGLNAQASGLNREAQAIPLITQQNLTAQGRIASEGGIAPENSAALRNNAIKALSIAAQSDIALAAAQGSEIRLNAAKDKAKQIVDIKYAQIEAELKAKQLQYDLNKDVLTRLDSKRSEALQVALKKEEQQIADAKENEKGIADISILLSKNGQDPNIIKDAKTPLQAIQMAGAKLQDPRTKFELQSLQLDIRRKQLENALIGQPTQAQRQAEAKALASAEGQNEALKDKLDLIDVIQNSNGIAERVGTNIFSRKPTTFGGGLTRTLSVVGIPGLVQGIARESTGSGQAFSGAVHRLASNEFLDALINAKKSGATFGALTDREGDALRAAATQLNDWEVKKNGVGTGTWNIDQKRFLEEVNRIKTLAQKATGYSIQPEEQQLLDDIFGGQIDPSQYYK